jgi:hypothetical protein
MGRRYGVVRDGVVPEAGPFDKNLRFIAADGDFPGHPPRLQLACHGKAMVVPDAIVDHRLSASAHAPAAIMRVRTEDMIAFGKNGPATV